MLLFVLPDQIYSSPLHFTIAQAQGTVIRVHFKALHSSLTNLGGNLSDHCQRKDMDKDNAPASQQIKQHYNQTQQAEKFTTNHTYFRRLTDEFYSAVFQLTVNFSAVLWVRYKIRLAGYNSAAWGLLLSCYVLPLCVRTLCIAIAFCYEMRIEASAERDSLLLWVV